MLYILRADSLIAVGLLVIALLWLRKVSLPPSPGVGPGPATGAVSCLPFSWPNAAKVAAFLLLFYPATIVSAALWTPLLWFIAEDGIAAHPPAAYVIKPEPYVCVWALPGLLLGLFSGATALDVALGALMERSYYSSAVLWGPAATRDPHLLLRTRRAIAVFALALMPLTVGFVTLFLPWNARFEQERIVIHDLWAAGEQVYSYDDIDKVVAVSPGGSACSSATAAGGATRTTATGRWSTAPTTRSSWPSSARRRGCR